MAIDDLLARDDIPDDAKELLRDELATRDEAHGTLGWERRFYKVIANAGNVAVLHPIPALNPTTPVDVRG